MTIHSLDNLYNNLLALCASSDAFYYVDVVRCGVSYRIFNYRLASYSDFQRVGAIECRGHTFRCDDGIWHLASLPSSKFFNYAEHVGWGETIDLNKISMVMDKADGSLISTVFGPSGDVFLKSKGSFISSQAIDATAYVASHAEFWDTVVHVATKLNYTVNFELVGPNNQIVLGYTDEKLIVLNARHMISGEYMAYSELENFFGDNVIDVYELPDDPTAFLSHIETTSDKIEGVVFVCNGVLYKHKNARYISLHHIKDSINNERRLWEACVNETADDLRALFVDDPVSIAKIIDMEEKAAKVYNHADKVVNEFYNENKELDRKSYAIKGQAELVKDGLFSLAMNLYLGKSLNLKDFLVKNYKKYGIKDEEADA